MMRFAPWNAGSAYRSTVGADDSDNDFPSVEDCVPVPEAVYPALADLLVHAWSRSSVDTTTTTTVPGPPPEPNPLQASASSRSSMDVNSPTTPAAPAAAVSLNVFDSIRVTQWLAVWNEYDLGLHHGDQETILDLLLLNAATAAAANSVVDALLQHWQDLPQLESLLNQYTASLTAKNSLASATASFLAGTGTSMATTASTVSPAWRARQEEVQQTTRRLQAEWKQHLGRFEQILDGLYRASSPPLRGRMRKGLGRVWHKRLHSTTTNSTRSVQRQNTQEAGWKESLQVLQRILAGSSSRTQVQEDLLWQILLPLHETDALLLWRDQTSVLESYHEVLVQCVANVIQKQPENGATPSTTLLSSVLQALLRPQILPLVLQQQQQQYQQKQ